MAKKEWVALLRSATAKDLKELLALKKDLDDLEKKQEELLKQFTLVSKDIGAIQTGFGKPGRKKAAPSKRKKARKAARKGAKKKRVPQPSLSSLIADILKEKRKPLGVNEICDALLREKNYKTKAKSFKSNVRILLYKNEKGLFKKSGPGRFRLAAAKKR